MDSNAALTQLQQQQSAAKDPSALLNEQRQTLGVQGAQDTVTGLRGAINNTTNLLKKVAPSVMGRTANSLVTSAQAGRQIQNESAPITQTLTEQTGQYDEAGRNLSDLEGKASQAATGLYQGQQDKMSYLQNLYNTLYGKEQDAAKIAREEADRQESIRQFNVAASDKASSGSKPSASETKSAVAQHVVSQLNSNRGKDGKVSNETWQNALNDFTAAGGTVRQFWQNYSSYVNGKYKTKYAGYSAR